MAAYYNEFDPYAAQWLRNLIDAGHIAPGVVDERSIEDVHPDDLKPFTQCHFFAGIGAWSLALRRSGWPDNRPVWTGSCPCQPFSAAGAGAGFDDERHLWPAFHWLIQECRPPILFGEQVASKAADSWIDLVQADLEALDYAFGAVPFPSSGVGAPHIRDRLYWLANSNSSAGKQGRPHFRGPPDGGHAQPWAGSGGGSLPDGLGNTDQQGSQRRSPRAQSEGPAVAIPSIHSGLANPDGRDASAEREQCSGQQRQQSEDGGVLQDGSAGPVNGLWRDADWLFCRDGKWRPVESGTFPLAHGDTARVGRLRAYGNAINVEAATQFIGAYLETQNR